MLYKYIVMDYNYFQRLPGYLTAVRDLIQVIRLVRERDFRYDPSYPR